MNYHVEKMRFGKIDSKTSNKSIIHYNHSISITGIPVEAYEYVVNGKSAIEWIMERYAITTDKKSGITTTRTTGHVSITVRNTFSTSCSA